MTAAAPAPAPCRLLPTCSGSSSICWTAHWKCAGGGGAAASKPCASGSGTTGTRWVSRIGSAPASDLIRAANSSASDRNSSRRAAAASRPHGALPRTRLRRGRGGGGRGAGGGGRGAGGGVGTASAACRACCSEHAAASQPRLWAPARPSTRPSLPPPHLHVRHDVLLPAEVQHFLGVRARAHQRAADRQRPCSRGGRGGGGRRGAGGGAGDEAALGVHEALEGVLRGHRQARCATTTPAPRRLT
jgi:hypothetical protein